MVSSSGSVSALPPGSPVTPPLRQSKQAPLPSATPPTGSALASPESWKVLPLSQIDEISHVNFPLIKIDSPFKNPTLPASVGNRTFILGGMGSGGSSMKIAGLGATLM